MASEKRLIDANALMEELSSLTMTITWLRAGKGVLAEFMNEYRNSVLRIVDEAPTVDAVEVVHGRWIAWQELFPKRFSLLLLEKKKRFLFPLRCV